jgi:hypothetical protein
MAHKRWDLLWVTDRLMDHVAFRASLPKNNITGTNKNSLCYAGKCKGDHTMTLRYMQCMSEECKDCLVCYRMIDCLTTNTFHAYQEMGTRHSCVAFNEKELSNEEQWQRGIPVDVKCSLLDSRSFCSKLILTKNRIKKSYYVTLYKVTGMLFY